MCPNGRETSKTRERKGARRTWQKSKTSLWVLLCRHVLLPEILLFFGGTNCMSIPQIHLLQVALHKMDGLIGHNRHTWATSSYPVSDKGTQSTIMTRLHIFLRNQSNSPLHHYKCHRSETHHQIQQIRYQYQLRQSRQNRSKRQQNLSTQNNH